GLELRARTFSAAVRVDEALASFDEALELAREAGDRDARSRLRAAALLMSVRYMGAFTDDDWVDRVESIADAGFAETAPGDATIEVGAVLLWRSWGAQRRTEPERARRALPDVPGAKSDAAAAIEIAQAVGSSVLHAVALEGLTWISFKEGL